MATTVADLEGLLKGIPSGAWVAISVGKQEVVAFGADAQAVFSQAQESGEEHPLIVRVPDQPAMMFL
jgi:hypothetical protein